MSEKRMVRRKSMRILNVTKPTITLRLEDLTPAQREALIEYIPDSDSDNANDCDNAPHNEDTATQVEVDKKKRGRPKSISAPLVQPDVSKSQSGKKLITNPNSQEKERTTKVSTEYVARRTRASKQIVHDSNTDVDGDADPVASDVAPIVEVHVKKRGRPSKMPATVVQPSVTKRKTSAANLKIKETSDYEADRFLRIQDNQQKFKDLKLPNHASAFNILLETDQVKKGKQKASGSTEKDGEYVPDSQSIVDGDDEPDSEENETIVVSEKKRGRPKSLPSDKSTSVQTVVAPLPCTVKPAATLAELEKKQKIEGPRMLDWQILKKLNVDTKFDEWLTPEWKALFSIRRPVYRELVYDFFSTYKLNKYVDDVSSKSAIQFKLMGREFNLSYAEFAVYMKLYTKEEVEGKNFIYGLDALPGHVSVSEFWSTFAAGDFHKNASCTSITDPSVRILHRAIAESINQRGTCTNHVTLEDMFYLYCVLRKKPINLAKCMARYLYKSPGKGPKSAVCGGAFVTELAFALGVVNEEKLQSMEPVSKTKLVDEAHLRRMELVEKTEPLRFVDPNQNDDVNEVNTGGQSALDARISWLSDAVHFMIQNSGLSFPAPPCLQYDAQNDPQNHEKSHPQSGATQDVTPVVKRRGSKAPVTSRDVVVGRVTRSKLQVIKDNAAVVDANVHESGSESRSF